MASAITNQSETRQHHLSTDIICRLGLSWITLWTVWSTATRSTMAALWLDIEGAGGYPFMALQAILAILVLLDVVLNEWTKIKWPWVRRHRDRIYAGIACLGLVIPTGMAYLKLLDLDTATYYLSMVVAAVMMCYVDARDKGNLKWSG